MFQLRQLRGQRLLDMCKGTGWIEILGAGEVHPHVLEMCGYDPKVW
jgi:phenylalanyl-tRNA synthetase alpha chain